MILGCASLGIGAAGAALPILPSFPFLLRAAYCFARSSERLHTWFISTSLYKNNLESYVRGRGMTRGTKVKIMLTVTALMSFGFYMMLRKNLTAPCILLAVVWIFHVGYFTLGVKTAEG